jgi:predicted aspartyl protease
VKANNIQEAGAVGRITVSVNLANRVDVELAKVGALPADQVRRATVEGAVDSGANHLVLPVAVAEQLGLPKAGKMKVRYADRRTATRDMAEMVEVELAGRKGTFRTLLEPNRTTALIGAIVLEDLDLLVDYAKQRLYPRDPDRIIAEVE